MGFFYTLKYEKIILSVCQNDNFYRVIFSDGYKHTDYKSGDKIAAVGVGSLVAGSLGAKVIAKTGFFAKLLPPISKLPTIAIALISTL